MGAACTLRMTPGGALAVGTLAGSLSVCGYVFGTGNDLFGLGVSDTCGVHSLHGMPAILGRLYKGGSTRVWGGKYVPSRASSHSEG